MSELNFFPFGDNGKSAPDMQRIRKMLPLELGVLLTRYVDPFIGSGQMYSEIMENYGIEDAVICDTNPEIINVYNRLKHNSRQLIEILWDYETRFNQGSWKERHNFYRTTLCKYNYVRSSESNTLSEKRAAMFLFLGETYKIFRNSSENIIAPDYIPEPINICRQETLKGFAKHLHNTKIICGDYKECLPYVNNKTFLFLNPPMAKNHSPKDIKAVESFCRISGYLGAEILINPLTKNTGSKKEHGKHKE